MAGPTKDQVLKLMQEKDKIENEISELGIVLQKNNIGMADSLVDENGFPRHDIDVYQVRHARHRIICLQNDHKAIMKEIERGLATLHAQPNGSGMANGGASTSNTILMNGHASEAAMTNSIGAMRVSDPSPAIPIAKINLVCPGSPAEDAGLMVNDHIVEFGSVNASNFKTLTQIGEVVQHSVNSAVLVKILRGSQRMNVSLTPCTWSGRGLLGCNIIPVDSTL